MGINTTRWTERYQSIDPKWKRWSLRMKQGKWAGEEPIKHIPAFMRLPAGHRYAGGIVFPRFADDVQGVFIDTKTCPDGEQLYLAPSLELRSYQKEAVLAAVQGDGGIIRAPCAGGKTTIGVGLIAALNTPTIILVDTTPLAKQWLDRISEQLVDSDGNPPEVTQAFGGKALKAGRITVATIQSLCKQDWTALEAWGRQFGLVIFDEAHVAPAKYFSKALMAMPARYRVGLTATPERHDGTTHLLWWHFRDVVYEITQEELNEAGVTRPAIVQVIESGFRPEKVYAVVTSEKDAKVADDDFHVDEFGSRRCLTRGEAEVHSRKLRAEGLWCKIVPDDSWSSVTKQMALSQSRNAAICDWVEARCAEGRTVLILTERTRHTMILAALLSKRGIDAAALHGKMRRKNQDGLLERMRNKEVQVVIATTIADKGLDVPRLDTGMLAVPTKSMGRVQQRIGRIMRRAPDKLTPMWGDVVDAPAEFRRMAQDRMARYRALGCKV